MEKSFINGTFKKGGKKEKDGEKEIYRAVANSAAIDRDNEIILPSGVENLDDWLTRNPVIFYQHAWMTYDSPTKEQLPIGRATEAFQKKNGDIEIAWWFHASDFGKEVQFAVDEEVLSATSIGFMPKNWVTKPEEIRAIMDSNDIDMPTRVIDGEEFDRLPYAVCTRWELLELSVVSIPSLREAEILRDLSPDSALALAVKSLSSVGKPANLLGNQAETPEDPDAKATPDRRRQTFAEKYQGGFSG